VSEDFAERLAARSRYRGRGTGRSADLTIVRTNPRRVPAAALEAWAVGRIEKLPERTHRELLHSELLLLQKRYAEILVDAKPSQRRPLQEAHLAAYRRLQAILDDADPPLTTTPPKPRKPKPAAPQEPELWIPEDPAF